MKYQKLFGRIRGSYQHCILPVAGWVLFSLTGMSHAFADGRLPDFALIFEQESSAVVRIEATATMDNAEREGDIILSLNQKSVSNTREFASISQQLPIG